jgi:hypothetical protein
MPDKAKAAEAKAKGNAALSAKDFDAAIKHYTEVRRFERGSRNAGAGNEVSVALSRALGASFHQAQASGGSG